MHRKATPAIVRILKRIEICEDSGCWEWIGHTNPRTGYGKIYHNGKHRLVHRISYESFHGPIEEGLTIDHLCRNRKCVNPDHLEAVTLGENNLRGSGPAAINARKVVCIKGHQLTGKNLYITPDGRRNCTICRTEAVQRWQETRRKAIARDTAL